MNESSRAPRGRQESSPGCPSRLRAHEDLRLDASAASHRQPRPLLRPAGHRRPRRWTAPPPEAPAESERAHGLVRAAEHSHRSDVAALRQWINHPDLRDDLPLPDLTAEHKGNGFEKAVAAYEAALAVGNPPPATDPAPVATDPDPVIPDPGPVVSDPAPVVTDPKPAVSDPAPVVSVSAPVASDLTPVVTDPDPLLDLLLSQEPAPGAEAELA